jgi:hypothetical protein
MLWGEHRITISPGSEEIRRSCVSRSREGADSGKYAWNSDRDGNGSAGSRRLAIRILRSTHPASRVTLANRLGRRKNSLASIQ